MKVGKLSTEKILLNLIATFLAQRFQQPMAPSCSTYIRQDLTVLLESNLGSVEVGGVRSAKL